MKALLLAATAAATVALAGTASAASIVYTFDGTFTGTIGGQAFSQQATFTGTGDPTTVAGGGFGYNFISAVPLTTLTALSGGQTFNITSPVFFYRYDAGNFGGANARLGLGFDNSGNNAIGLESAAFNGYDGVSNFSTTPGTVYTGGASFSTNAGNVVITGVTGASFGAAVPEPTTWAMMIGGAGLVGGAMRRRRSNVTTRVRFA